MFADATLMVQREVADRLAARPGTQDYGVLTVMMQLHGKIDRLLNLPPGAFRPAPKVRSSVVRLDVRTAAGADCRPSPVRAGRQSASSASAGRRSRTASRAWSHEPAPVLKAAGIDPGAGAETLSLEELAALTDVRCAGLAGDRPVL